MCLDLQSPFRYFAPKYVILQVRFEVKFVIWQKKYVNTRVEINEWINLNFFRILDESLHTHFTTHKNAMFYPMRMNAEMHINSNMYLGQTRILTCLLSNQSLRFVCKHWLKMHKIQVLLKVLRIISKLIHYCLLHI